MLIQHLPPGGATYRAIHGHGWTDTEYVLASVIDDVRQVTTAVYRTGSGKRVPDPRRFPRPGQDDRPRLGDRAGRSVADVVGYLDSLMPPSTEQKGA